MPRVAKEMGVLAVKALQHSGKKNRPEFKFVGGVPGLALQLLPTGGRTWILHATVGGKRCAIGLGGFPTISLAQARERAREAREMIRQGLDPIEDRKEKRAALAAAQRRGLLFKDAATRWISAKLSDRPVKSQKAVLSTLERYAFPEIGSMTVQDIGVQDISRSLTPIWTTKIDTAAKLRTYLEGILSWATVAGHRTGDNPAAWRGNLKELLPSHGTITKGKKSNFPAVALTEVQAWWAHLQTKDGMGAAALRFAVLCASRSGEVRGATWSEFHNLDGDNPMWLIPANRMKSGAEHRIPLTAEALAILEATPRMAGVPFVFPSVTGKMMSDMTISAVMRRMQAEAEEAATKAGLDPAKAGWRDPRSGRPAVPHGVARSTFRDWCAETGVDRDLAEIALSHQVGSVVERSYRRTDMIARRKTVQQAWADFLEGREGDSVVVPIRAAAGG